MVVARNEELLLPATLDALQAQTLKPSKTVVVDDGSFDATRSVALRRGCTVVTFQSHARSYAGRPELADLWNWGFFGAMKAKPDFLLMLGADHALPPAYLENAVRKMAPGVAMVCGAYSGENSATDNPGGSGRLISVAWFSRYRFRFPVSYGWESWMIYRARMDGYATVSDPDNPTTLLRPITRNPRKMLYWGRGSWCLGATFPYMVNRCLTTLGTAGLVGAAAMMLGYFYHPRCRKLDCAAYVHEIHRRNLRRGLLRRLGFAS